MDWSSEVLGSNPTSQNGIVSLRDRPSELCHEKTNYVVSEQVSHDAVQAQKMVRG